MIKASIANLDKSISNVTREQPKLRSFISELEQEREKKLEEIKGLQSEIDGIYQQEDERTHLRDINARRGLINKSKLLKALKIESKKLTKFLMQIP